MSPSATPATPNDTGCRQVPRRPHKPRRTASNRTQARHQSQPSATQSEGRCQQMPHLPHKVKLMSPSATSATQNGRRCGVTKCHTWHAKITLDVAKCHTCHTNSGGDHGIKRDPPGRCEVAVIRPCFPTGITSGAVNKFPKT